MNCQPSTVALMPRCLRCVNPVPLRTFFALHGCFPRVAEWLARLIGSDATLTRIAEARALAQVNS